jgi:DNA-directed RNA polymerase specialized sigma24 family protein
MDISDADLIRLAQAGDVDALGELLSRHRDAWIAAARWRGAADDAEDIAQDVAEEIIRALPSLDPSLSIRANGNMRAIGRAIDLHRDALRGHGRYGVACRSDEIRGQRVVPTVLEDLVVEAEHAAVVRMAEAQLSGAQLEEFRRHEADPFAGTEALARQSPRSTNCAKAHWWHAKVRMMRALTKIGVGP